MTKRIYEPMLGHPSLTGYQQDQLRLLEQCATHHQEETGQVACGGCPKMDGCFKAWGQKCDNRCGVDLC